MAKNKSELLQELFNIFYKTTTSEAQTVDELFRFAYDLIDPELHTPSIDELRKYADNLATGAMKQYLRTEESIYDYLASLTIKYELQKNTSGEEFHVFVVSEPVKRENGQYVLPTEELDPLMFYYKYIYPNHSWLDT